jgi:hypothetical protein
MGILPKVVPNARPNPLNLLASGMALCLQEHTKAKAVGLWVIRTFRQKHFFSSYPAMRNSRRLKPGI